MEGQAQSACSIHSGVTLDTQAHPSNADRRQLYHLLGFLSSIGRLLKHGRYPLVESSFLLQPPCTIPRRASTSHYQRLAQLLRRSQRPHLRHRLLTNFLQSSTLGITIPIFYLMPHLMCLSHLTPHGVPHLPLMTSRRQLAPFRKMLDRFLSNPKGLNNPARTGGTVIVT